VGDLLIQINLAKEEVGSARSLLDRLGISYSLVESGDRVSLIIAGRHAMAFAAAYAAIVDKLEGEALELVYLAGELIVEDLGKYAVFRAPTPREAREAVEHISFLARAEARGRVVKAGGEFVTRLLDVSLNSGR
jgi:hypothetical protein